MKTLEEFGKQMEQIGKDWIAGKIEFDGYYLRGKNINLSPRQKEFVNSKKRFCLYGGGYAAGKSIALFIKLILTCLCFPRNTVLLGREHLSDIETTILPDLFDLMDNRWYQHRIKDGIIKFFNGSKIILFGLAALQEGALSDIKKSQQKLKSLNLGSFFIDQLEEVEKDVFITLDSRLRKSEVPIRQGNMTCNPANFWAYQFFKLNTDNRDDILLVEGSMLDNKDNLPEDYIVNQLKYDDRYKKRYVYGIWSPDVLTDRNVFGESYINEFHPREPISIQEGCKIWAEYDNKLRYQMAVDPSEGSEDPSSVQVISSLGEQVAKFNGKIPIFALGEKVKFLYKKYNKPRIIPEINAAGQALLLQIRDLNIYKRKTYDEKIDQETEKLGWRTTNQSKEALISHFVSLLREKFVKIYDKQTIEEMKTFVWSDTAREKGAAAQKGFHDDDIMAIMLAFWEISPKLVEKKELKQKIEKQKAILYRYTGCEYR